jgi:hypothetical protein
MKPFTTVAIFFLGLVSALQLVRSLQGWEVIINGVSIPIWASGIACVAVGGLAVMLWRESRG